MPDITRGTETKSSGAGSSGARISSLPMRNMPSKTNKAIHMVRTTSRDRRYVCQIRSALEMNLNAAANSTNPRVTLTVLSSFRSSSQFLGRSGEQRQQEKRHHKAAEKASIPKVGQNHSPSAAATSTRPTKATVQVKKTVVDVAAATPTAT